MRGRQEESQKRLTLSDGDSPQSSRTKASMIPRGHTPQEVLAVFVQPSYDLNPEVIKSSLCLALDDVQDPGNLGSRPENNRFGIEKDTKDTYLPLK